MTIQLLAGLDLLVPKLSSVQLLMFSVSSEEQYRTIQCNYNYTIFRFFYFFIYSSKVIVIPSQN